MHIQAWRQIWTKIVFTFMKITTCTYENEMDIHTCMDSYLYKTRIHNIMQRAFMKVVTPGNDSTSASGFRPRPRRKQIGI